MKFIMLTYIVLKANDAWRVSIICFHVQACVRSAYTAVLRPKLYHPGHQSMKLMQTVYISLSELPRGIYYLVINNIISNYTSELHIIKSRIGIH